MKRYISFLLAVLMLATLVPSTALADSGTADMKASNDLKILIKYWEGASLKAYKAHPSEKYWTIGYGHYGSDVYEGMEITAEQADAYFEQDIVQFETAANRTIAKYGLTASQNVFDALVSLAYNFGPNWVEANTGWRLARYIQSNFKDSYGNRIPDLEIADAFAVLCSAGGDILPGLVKRRVNEAEIFLYGNYNTALTNFVTVTIDANGGAVNGNRVVAYNKDKPYGSLPTATRQGYSLDYWKDSDTGAVLTGSTVAEKSRYITAVWSGGDAPATYKLTVSGGEGSGSYAEGAKMFYEAGNAETAEQYCDIIVRESQRMNTMIMKLLEITKYSSGAYELETTEFNIKELADDWFERNSSILSEKGISVENLIPDDMKGSGDRVILESVVNNYMSNAVSHCDGEKKISAYAEDAGEFYRVYVFNTGEHIADNDIDKIWTSFYRADKSLSRSQGRFGLGLAIVVSIQNLHKAAYGVENVENGVRFYFDIRKAAGKAEKETETN